jgi:hypothetical protein
VTDKEDILSALRLFQAMPKRREMLFEDYKRQRDAARAPAPHSPKRKASIYTVTIQCVQGMYLKELCTRVVEMKDTSNLLGLHYVIQDAVEFDDDHMFEFYAGRNYWRRQILFTEPEDWDSAADIMEETALRDIWPLPRDMKLFYWFDYGDDWKFMITKGRSERPPEKGVKYPRLVEAIGPNPCQYPEIE